MQSVHLGSSKTEAGDGIGARQHSAGAGEALPLLETRSL